MLGRVIAAVVFTVAVSAATTAQERLPRAPEVAPSNTGDGRPIDLLSGFAPAPSASTSAKAGTPKRVVVRRAPTLDLMTRVMEPGKPAPVPLNRTFMRAPSNAGEGRIRGIRGVPLDFEQLEDFWLRPGGSALPGRSRETEG